MAKGYNDIIWLAGQVLLFRDFVAKADEKGIDAVLADCPYGDLRDDQKAVFEAAFKNPKLRKVIEQWWAAYDEQRTLGEVPEATPWA